VSACQMVETAPVQVSRGAIPGAERSAAKAHMVEPLKDPESVKFRREITYRSRYGDAVMCGQWDAKNSYGGYNGYKDYYIRVRGGEVKSFHQEYPARLACSAAAKGQLDLPVDQVPDAKQG
jgi:hypothetical protein